MISPAGDPDSRVILVSELHLTDPLLEQDFHSMNVSCMSCVNASFIVRTN